jgi:predicted phosphodiesterase
MKLWIASDLHLEIRKDFVPGRRRPDDFDVLVLPGDVMDGDVVRGVETAAAMAGGRPAIYVAGNHCHWGTSFQAVAEEGLAAGLRTGVHFLQNASIEIDGVTFFGATLWDEMLPDPKARRPDLSAIMSGLAPHPQPHSSLPFGEQVFVRSEGGVMDRRAKNRNVRAEHEKSVAAMIAARPDVVVTHYPPPAALVAQVSPRLWIHGHEHRVRDETIGTTRVLDNAVGMPSENRRLDNLCAMVVEVEPGPVPAPR